MRFHYTSGLLALRICAPQREHCLWESRPLHWKPLPQSIECEFQSSEQFVFENNFKWMIVNSGIWMSQVRRPLLGLISSIKAQAVLYKQAFFKYNSYQIECFLKQSICIGKLPFENNFKRTKILFSNGPIWMSLVCRELTGIIIAL